MEGHPAIVSVIDDSMNAVDTPFISTAIPIYSIERFHITEKLQRIHFANSAALHINADDSSSPEWVDYTIAEFLLKSS